jgi:hypothetical protein
MGKRSSSTAAAGGSKKPTRYAATADSDAPTVGNWCHSKFMEKDLRKAAKDGLFKDDSKIARAHTFMQSLNNTLSQIFHSHIASQHTFPFPLPLRNLQTSCSLMLVVWWRGTKNYVHVVSQQTPLICYVKYVILMQFQNKICLRTIDFLNSSFHISTTEIKQT